MIYSVDSIAYIQFRTLQIALSSIALHVRVVLKSQHMFVVGA